MSKKLYVGNLPFSVTEQSLYDTFSQYGEVGSAKLVMDHQTGRSKGFGFIEMLDSEEADLAVSKLNGSQLDGRNLTVNEARPQPERNRSHGMQYGDSQGRGRRY